MDVLSFVIVGHVDHGKSTLIGRLLHDTCSLASDRIEEMKRVSLEQGKEAEYAYLLDHLEEERAQGITIDTTQVFFKTEKRRYVIIDAPGHVEFVKNMITGASQAEAAVLIIDVTEGVKEQTKRHSYMLSLLGLNQVVVVLNKMDLVNFSKHRFDAIKKDAAKWLDSINIKPKVYIPISAITGDNIAFKSENIDWYDGPTFIESLDNFQNKRLSKNKLLILPVQDIYKIDGKRIAVGRVEAGVIEQGINVKILPSGEKTSISSIEKFLEKTKRAVAGQCIGVTTTEPVFLDRGNIICLQGSEPVMTDRICANVFWMSKQPLNKNEKLTLRCATQQMSCKLERIPKRINSSTLQIIEKDAASLENLDVAEVVIKTKKAIAVKNFNDVNELGRFVLVRDENICGGGIITCGE